MRKAEKRAQEKVDIVDLAKNKPELYKSEVDNAEKIRALVIYFLLDIMCVSALIICRVV